jgi:hypothetical protein
MKILIINNNSIHINQIHTNDNIHQYYQNYITGKFTNEYMGPDFSTLDERIQQVEKLGASVNTSNIMPYDVKLSSNLSKEDWISRLLNRTAVFIKPEKGFDKEVSKRLEKAEIPFEVGENAEIKLKQGVNLEVILE